MKSKVTFAFAGVTFAILLATGCSDSEANKSDVEIIVDKMPQVDGNKEARTCMMQYLSDNLSDTDLYNLAHPGNEKPAEVGASMEEVRAANQKIADKYNVDAVFEAMEHCNIDPLG